ncbi:uncharacterized protein BDR25DRAFT_2849 [Lindgomyces ingoldianus]|uniref:Uncharacterized protein n=1 Tax=Lindgomyces ingoldianus TaxID=673940 RepID=A0ACB6REF2_9PLEO|nr:uncharacterized protein BDR25DRAFT_2849 [Lindgomyces ingoldianus]KAF2477658.1 hypothetical protein BDR25DRAFT_2849 [Lindgomyces ingoldianus]
MGAGFDKPANARYYAPRFPRAPKIHQDRTFKDTVSFDEMQELAQDCMEMSQQIVSENKNRLEKLKETYSNPEHLIDSTYHHLSRRDSSSFYARRNATRYPNHNLAPLSPAVLSRRHFQKRPRRPSRASVFARWRRQNHWA